MTKQKNQLVVNHKVILNLIQDLQRLPLRLVNNLRGRFQDPILKHYGAEPKVMPRFGMTILFNKGAFTLIELLVVVLIIGLLAAVAVPQYKKAVLKSRFKTLYPVARSLAQAQESYYLGTGDYAENLSELDVSVPGNPTGQTTTLSDGTQVKLGAEENHVYVRAEKGDNALMIYQNHSPNFAGETHCEAKQDDTLANWLCEKGLDGTFVGNKFGYAIYALDPTDPNSTLGRIYHNEGGAKVSFTDGDVCMADQRWTDCGMGSVFSNYAYCIADSGRCRNGKMKNHSVCLEKTSNCYGGTYENYSVCKGIGGVPPTSCAWNNYTNHSVCFGDGQHACSSVRSDLNGEHGFDQYSSCVGNKENSCRENFFTNYSVCFANASGACTGANYDETSCCQGNFCTEHQCDTKPLTKNLTITQPVYEEMITPAQ